MKYFVERTPYAISTPDFGIVTEMGFQLFQYDYNPQCIEAERSDPFNNLRLSDLAIRQYLTYLHDIYPNTVFSRWIEHVYKILFPETQFVSTATTLSEDKLLSEANNTGSVDEISSKVDYWYKKGLPVIITYGGYEMTLAHILLIQQLTSYRYSINDDVRIVMLQEPYSYYYESRKDRPYRLFSGPISTSIASRLIGSRGVLGMVPRPYPSYDPKDINEFYNQLHREIMGKDGHKGYVLISDRDPYQKTKQYRSIPFKIPTIPSLSTTQIIQYGKIPIT